MIFNTENNHLESFTFHHTASILYLSLILYPRVLQSLWSREALGVFSALAGVFSCWSNEVSRTSNLSDFIVYGLSRVGAYISVSLFKRVFLLSNLKKLFNLEFEAWIIYCCCYVYIRLFFSEYVSFSVYALIFYITYIIH